MHNSFLHLCVLCQLLFLLGGCAAKHPVLSQTQPEALHKPPLPLMGYAIQAGAFADPENAVRLTKRLFSLGLSAYYFRGEGDLYRVRFGNYPSSAVALGKASRLQGDRIIDVFIVVRPESYPAVRYRDQGDRLREQVVAVARQFIGVPYRWGDVSPVVGFDCSGLAMMVYQLIGLDMPRISSEQFRIGRPVDRQHLRPGDLVFFTSGFTGQASHVGIYLGGDQFIHAPGSGKTVSQASLTSAYFQKHFLGGRAFL